MRRITFAFFVLLACATSPAGAESVARSGHDAALSSTPKLPPRVTPYAAPATAVDASTNAAINPVATTVTNAVTTTPMEFMHVGTGGAWNSGAAAGDFRFLASPAASNTAAVRLFVQWVDNSGAIVATSEVVELSEKPSKLVNFNVEVDYEGTSVFLEMAEIGTGFLDDYLLLLDGPGHYTIAPQGN